MVAGTRHLGTHPQPLQVVVAALWGDMVSARPLRDPASHQRTGPEASAWCWSLDGCGQLLLLLSGQEGAGPWRPEFPTAISEGGRPFPVVAMHHPARIVVAQADQPGSVFDGEIIGDQCQELPAACLNRRRCLARSLSKFRSGEMGMEGEAACHCTA